MSIPKQVVDQMGRQVQVPTSPKRIISLVPSQTELLYYLGLNEEVVGQTLFCVHPKDKHEQKPRVGGTKKLRMEAIHQLNPDLIIGNKEENERSQIEELQQHYPVWMSDITTLDEAFDMIQQVGDLVGKSLQAQQLVHQVTEGFQQLQASTPAQPLKVVYLIWRKPYMVAGADTFIHQMLLRCGWANAVEEHSRYPEVSPDSLKELAPDLILLSSEPYPFKEEHIAELQSLCPQSRIALVDGEIFSWYGSRLLQAPQYFQELSQRLAK